MIVSCSGAWAPPLVLLRHKIPRYIFVIITEGHYYKVEIRLNYQGRLETCVGQIHNLEIRKTT